VNLNTDINLQGLAPGDYVANVVLEMLDPNNPLNGPFTDLKGDDIGTYINSHGISPGDLLSGGFLGAIDPSLGHVIDPTSKVSAFTDTDGGTVSEPSPFLMAGPPRSRPWAAGVGVAGPP
jgi:hypothetical protein